MKFKKVLLCTLCSVFLATSVNVKPASALRCELWDLLNALVTPLPTNDTNTDLSALLAQLEQILQTIESINELEKYIDKLEKLSEDASSLSDALKVLKQTLMRIKEPLQMFKRQVLISKMVVTKLLMPFLRLRLFRIPLEMWKSKQLSSVKMLIFNKQRLICFQIFWSQRKN